MAEGLGPEIQKILNDELNSLIKERVTQQTLNKVGKEAKDQIVKRTRLGLGVRNGKARPLKALSESYIEQRKKRRAKLSKFTTTKKSNLTATGQFLNSLSYKVNPITKKVELFFKENRRRELNGGPPRVRHIDLLQYVSEQGRPFFELADFEIRKIQSIIFQSFK